MTLTLKVLSSDGSSRAMETGVDLVHLCYRAPFEEGDCLCIESSAPGFLLMQLEDTMAPAYVYMAGTSYALSVPFGEKRVSYSPKSFMGDCHLLMARTATEEEMTLVKNLAFNPFDSHDNATLFPHAHANVETRGESVFAARNAINGNTANHSHGNWPFESWGINRRDDAEITVDFGRPIRLDKVILTLRADFPHDNWWEQATLNFPDGDSEIIRLVKSDAPQAFSFPPRIVSRVSLGCLIKNAQNPSPFPALTQIECWGVDLPTMKKE